VNQRIRLPFVTILLAAVFAVAIMLPRLQDPHFGLLDDGATVQTAQSLAEGHWLTWDVQGGRFRPGYWAFWLLPYLVGGANPLVFFIGSAALLAAVSVLVTVLIGLWTRRWWIGLLAAVILMASPPSVELYYTLSKGEGVQVFWILVALLMLTLFSGRQGRRLDVLSIVLTSLAMLAACFSKETGVVVLPLSVAALFIAWMGERSMFRWHRHTPYVQAVLAAFVAVLVFFSARWMVLRISVVDVGGYASNYAFDLRVLAVSAYRWAGLLLSDFPYLLALPLGMALAWKDMPRTQRQVLFLAALWSAGWVGIFLPWDGITVYFQYPAAVGIAVMTAFTLAGLIRTVRRHALGRRGTSLATFAVLGVLLFASVGNAWTNARVQLAVDRVNAQALAAAVEEAPGGGRVLINIQDPNEYTFEIPLHFEELYGRADLRVETVQLADFPPSDAGDAIVLAPFMRNAPVLTVRTGVVEPYITQWDESLSNALPEGTEQLARIVTRETLFSFKLPQLLCGVINAETYCRSEPQALDLLAFEAGWRVFRLP